MLTIIHFFANIVYRGEQPERKVEQKMGYFQNLEVELQEIHDPKLREIIEWKRAHQHMLTAEELWAIMTDEVKQEAALARWRYGVVLPAPVKAVNHVALQARRRDLRVARSWQVGAGWLLIAVSLVTGVAVLVVNL
jgi:hypothetical protein